MHAQLNNTIHWIAENPLTFLLQGTRVHLWFLPALIISLFILTVFITVKIERYVIYFSIALYAIHLLIGPYSHTILGIPSNLNTCQHASNWGSYSPLLVGRWRMVKFLALSSLTCCSLVDSHFTT